MCSAFVPQDVVPTETDGAVQLRVDVIEALGTESFVHGEVAKTGFVARVEPRAAVEAGQTLHFNVQPGRAHIFDIDSGLALWAQDHKVDSPA